MRIEELGPPDADHSTGLILHWRDRLLFAVQPADQWHDTAAGRLAHVVGIGGHLEAGENWIQALSAGQLHRTATRPVPLGTLLDGGASILESEPVPRTTLLAPRGTAQWYDVWQERIAALG